MNDCPPPTATGSPTRLFLVSSGAIFVGELLIMLLLDALPSFPGWVEALLDSALLSLLVFPLLYLCVFRPLTTHIASRQRAEEALRESKEDLQQYTVALESAHQSLEEFYRLAESATQAKSDFLASMSHEIRSPMTAILGYADLIVARNIEPAVRKHVEVIKRNGEHLLGLLNDILDLAKVEAGKLQIEPTQCSPVELVTDAVSMMSVRAAAKGLKLETEWSGPLPRTVVTDPLRLRQILVNLLGNAIKFTEQGAVRIAVQLVSDSSPPRLRFDVTDTGIGMSEDQLAKLFVPFSQVDSSAERKLGGTGLGLVISKHLVEALGGAVEVRSEPGKGSTFIATIDPGPLAGIAMVHPTASPGSSALSGAPPAVKEETRLDIRLLLAEDSDDNRRLLTWALTNVGVDVTSVENGRLAVDAALAACDAGAPFDVILMDMQMPVMDGYEATRTLRQRGYTGPIVAVTAHAMTGDREKCLDTGCDDYVAKPIDRRRLVEVVRRWASQTLPTAR